MAKYWKAGEQVGIELDEEENTITIFAGTTAIQINGAEGKIALAGSISEMNGGSRTEEIFLRKESSPFALIPSTVFTPIPQALPNIPIGEISGLISDISKMLSILG